MRKSKNLLYDIWEFDADGKKVFNEFEFRERAAMRKAKKLKARRQDHFVIVSLVTDDQIFIGLSPGIEEDPPARREATEKEASNCAEV